MPMHEAMAATLDTVIEEIRRIQADARASAGSARGSTTSRNARAGR